MGWALLWQKRRLGQDARDPWGATKQVYFLFPGVRVWYATLICDTNVPTVHVRIDIAASACVLYAQCDASGVESMRMHVATHAAAHPQAYLTPAHTATCLGYLSSLSAYWVPYVATWLSTVSVMGQPSGGEGQHLACSYRYHCHVLHTWCLYRTTLTGHGVAAAAVVGVE